MNKQKNKNKILGRGGLFCFFVCLMLLSNSAAAQIKLETGLPNIPNNQLPAGTELPSYINYLFIFGLGAIGILALARMTMGGMQYILAAGNVGDKADAKDTIQQALIGLGLLLASYLLLRTINPDLVNLKTPNLTPPQFKGEICLEWSQQGLQACMDAGGMSWEECKEAACTKEKTTLGPTGPDEPPQPGRKSALIYIVSTQQACANNGGKVFEPCKTYCLTTPGLCRANTICCGK